MTNQQKTSVAEQIDQMMQRVALGVFLVAVAYAISTLEYFVSAQTKDILDIVSRVLGIFILILVFPKFLKFVILRRNNREACREPEGFVVEMFNQATGKAFQFTFIFLITLEFVSKGFLADLPGVFFVKATISFSLAFFSLTFFYLNRGRNDSEPDDNFVNGENT